jgi:hypothetical protein
MYLRESYWERILYRRILYRLIMYRRMKDTFNIRSIFGHVRKIVESDCYFVMCTLWLSVRLSLRNDSSRYGRVLIKFYI